MLDQPFDPGSSALVSCGYRRIIHDGTEMATLFCVHRFRHRAIVQSIGSAANYCDGLSHSTSRRRSRTARITKRLSMRREKWQPLSEIPFRRPRRHPAIRVRRDPSARPRPSSLSRPGSRRPRLRSAPRDHPPPPPPWTLNRCPSPHVPGTRILTPDRLTAEARRADRAASGSAAGIRPRRRTPAPPPSGTRLKLR